MSDKTYTGSLVGGPDDGNVVTASTNRIPTKVTTELWLDGEGANKDVHLVIVKGSYIWSEKLRAFKWELESADFYRPIAV